MDVLRTADRPTRIHREMAPSRRVQLRDDVPVIDYMAPPSFAAEQYRSLAVQVEERINPLATWGYALTVTSPEEGAGKTLTSLNLALTLTRGGAASRIRRCGSGPVPVPGRSGQAIPPLPFSSLARRSG